MSELSISTLKRQSTYRCQERLCHKSRPGVQLHHVSCCEKLRTERCTAYSQHTKSFISEISLSTSSMNCIIKSTNLCFNISSVWKFVIKKEISYPCRHTSAAAREALCSICQGITTLIGFLRRMKKDSALCVKNLVNLWTRMCSISSACLILMLIRMELMLGSIKTRSFSFRAIVNGVRRTSGDVWASISGTL